MIRLAKIVLAACLCFVAFVLFHEFNARQSAQVKIEEHARIIADSLWNYNLPAASEYLKLVVSSQNYGILEVVGDNGEVLKTIHGAPLGAVEQFLVRLHFIPRISLSAPVGYRGATIGSIRAIWLPRTLYTYLYFLLALTMGTVILLLYTAVRREKIILEQRVRERTEDLAIVNSSLLGEIQERTKTEAILRQSEMDYRALYEESKKAEQVYRSLIDSSADAIAIYGLDQKVEFVSAAFSRLFGWSQEEAAGRTIPPVPADEREHAQALMTELISHGTLCQNHETRRCSRDGRAIEVSISASRFNDHQEQPTGILVVYRDISERKKLEQQLQRADRMEAIGTLAGGIAHDFNNLLMGIQGSVSLFMSETDNKGDGSKKLKDIERYVENGKSLTRQLLGFARGGKYEVKPTDINALIREENLMFARTRKEIALHEQFAADLQTVEVDRGQIRQVLLNLYVNAWQAMPAGGDIIVRTENVFVGDAAALPFPIPVGTYVKISVIDSGVGMDRGTREKIFDPFFTTKGFGRGTGLGLASAYGIIKNHGGFIDVHSEPGDGASFTIYLPASDERITPEAGESGELVRGEGTVLLVDDEPMILAVAAEMLEVIGFEVITASSGAGAVDIFRQNPARFDIVLLDMIMPELGGGEVFDLLRGIDPAVRVILSSGYSLDGKAADIIRKGCRGFLQKPFDIKEMSLKLNEALARSRPLSPVA